ncbi:MAG: NAD(P)H-dependent glycerol-3-phosphate dehydrogenase [Lachnospiraceae bacterium]|nr:NAD(P)H-dependent glycerol-3-phosphate dehydrogenase [Lachnospiraceae bacterium]
MIKTAVIGCGAWGLAIARHLSGVGNDVVVWCHSEEARTELETTRKSMRAFPDVELPALIRYTTDMEKAVKGKDLVVFSVASPFTRATAKNFAPFIADGQRIVTVTKGIEEDTLMTQVQILRDELPSARVSALSGPTHAEEVILDMPTLIVSASEDREQAEYVQEAFMGPTFRVYTSPDVLGVELGGSLKNVIALAAGMADGMGYGDNIKAALITRGIHEISGLAVKMGAMPETLNGLSGIGDLIVTCASMHSRNRRAGILIGQGKSMDEAMKEVGQVVEGVYSAKAAMALSLKYETPLPIVSEVNHILFEGKDPREAMMDLMLRDRKMEARLDPEDLPREWK